MIIMIFSKKFKKMKKNNNYKQRANKTSLINLKKIFKIIKYKFSLKMKE